MSKFIIERSAAEDHTTPPGLVIPGLLNNRHTNLVRPPHRSPDVPSVRAMPRRFGPVGAFCCSARPVWRQWTACAATS
ncbi:MAG: hypothetical protein ACLFOY_01875, partial [Desulfatibacillaceae bacterium]